jgi:hypothetical protein
MIREAGAARMAAPLLPLAVLAFAAHRALVPMGETDLFFHLKIGQLILERHTIPFRNLFSFTFPDHPDPDLSWGFQVLVALLFRAGGFAAIVLAKAALFVSAVALCWRACRRSGASPLGTAAAMVLVVLAAEQRLVERPHLVTFVGLGLLLLLLAAVEAGRGRVLWLLPPLALGWANFHAGVFFAPLVVGLFALGAALDGMRHDPSPAAQPATVRRATATAVLAAAAMLLTPAGSRILPYLAWHTGVGSSRDIEEFRHVEAWSDPFYFVQVAICAITFLGAFRRLPLRHLLPLLVTGALAARSVRFVAEWALLAAPVVAIGLTRALAPLGRAHRPLVHAGAAALLVAAIVVERRGHPLELGLLPEVAPRPAIAFVTAHGLRERMYHDLDVGCYLLWEGWPRFQVFQDARLPAYPHSFHRALDQTPLDPAAFDALLTGYGVDAALLAEPGINIRAGSFDPERWALVYRAADALVFARRVPRHRAVIAEYEIPLRVRSSYTEGSRVEPLLAPPAASPVTPCPWQLRLGDALEGEGQLEGALDARERALAGGCLPARDEPWVRFHLGARHQRAGRLAQAIAEYDRVLALSPQHVDALTNRGFARLHSDPAGARADFEQALRLEPGRRDAHFGLAQLAR